MNRKSQESKMTEEMLREKMEKDEDYISSESPTSSENTTSINFQFAPSYPHFGIKSGVTQEHSELMKKLS